MTRTALGTFIFAGGFTLGVKRAGFDVLAQLEDGPYGVATTRQNHPALPVFTDPDAWPDVIGEDGRRPTWRDGAELPPVDFVYGNPPCAPFSNSGVSNKKVGLMDDWWRTDPRAQCVTRMFKVLENVRPKVWAWESVQPALRRGKDLVAELSLVAKTLGYQASYVLIDAVHLGVPQRRRRVFVVFHSVAIDWLYPVSGTYLAGWHGRLADGAVDMLVRGDPATVREAWEPILSGRVQDAELAGGVIPRHCIGQYNGDGILDRLPQGGSLKKLWEKEHAPETYELNAQGKVRGRPGFLYKRLAWDGQSPTLTGSASKTFHPDLNRYITVLEKQLLCGYPEDYAFVGSPINKLAQIAQAVMPPVGEWLGRNVMRALEADAPVEPGEPQIVDLEGEWNAGAPRVRSLTAAVKTEDVMSEAAHQAGDVLEYTRKTELKRAKNPNFGAVYGLLAMPLQASHLPLWEQYSGPTAIARALIAEGHDDGAILATTRFAMAGAKAAGVAWPKLFTRVDLARLRARIDRDFARDVVRKLNEA